MKNKFPLRIVEQDSKFKATTSIGQLQDRKRNIRQDLTYIEIDYTHLINTLQRILTQLHSSRKKDPRVYWLVGDYIGGFLKRIDQLGYYLVQQNTTLGKSIGSSESSVKKFLSFYRRFSKIESINPSIPWAKYRDNKVPIPGE